MSLLIVLTTYIYVYLGTIGLVFYAFGMSPHSHI